MWVRGKVKKKSYFQVLVEYDFWNFEEAVGQIRIETRHQYEKFQWMNTLSSDLSIIEIFCIMSWNVLR